MSALEIQDYQRITGLSCLNSRGTGKEKPQVLQEADHLAHCGTNGSPKEAYVIFNDLMKEFKKLTRTAQEMMPWISEETWRLVNSRIILRRRHTVGQRELWAKMSLFSGSTAGGQ